MLITHYCNSRAINMNSGSDRKRNYANRFMDIIHKTRQIPEILSSAVNPFILSNDIFG